MMFRFRWQRWSLAALLAAGGLVASIATVGAGGAGAAGMATTTTTSSTTTTTAAPPKNTQPPTLTGTPLVGDTLTATPGSWTGSKISFSYQFLRCDATGGSCFTGGSTTQKTYKLTSVDAGNTIRVQVTATNSGGSASATSAPSAVIRAVPAPPATGCPSGSGPVQAGRLTPPARLMVDRQDLASGIVRGSAQQLQERFHVSACNGRDVQGALVYVTAVPYQQFTIPPEIATGSDGWAVLTMTRLRGFPAARHQQLLVLFVRAREPGGNVLGGVSTRRLVSFRVDLGE
jgi:hypothetical protein